MTKLITGAIDDTESSPISGTGPILVTVTGVMKVGEVVITGDIGGGEAVAYKYTAGDPTSFARLEFTSGVTFKAYLRNTGGHDDTDVDVDYINVT